MRIRQVRNVSSMTFSKARKSPSFSKSVLRTTPRLRTWYTNPPGKFRDARGMHLVLPDLPKLVKFGRWHLFFPNHNPASNSLHARQSTLGSFFALTANLTS
jgi:hypothetical protein